MLGLDENNNNDDKNKEKAKHKKRKQKYEKKLKKYEEKMIKEFEEKDETIVILPSCTGPINDFQLNLEPHPAPCRIGMTYDPNIGWKQCFRY